MLHFCYCIGSLDKIPVSLPEEDNTVSLEFISYQTELSQGVCRIYIGPEQTNGFQWRI